MTTAKQASLMSDRAQKRIQREQANQARIEERRQAAARGRILRHDVPFRMREFKKELSKAVCDGKKEMRFSVNNDTEGYAVRERLLKRGFAVSYLHHEHGSTNMGDFSAPCTVEYDYYWLEVSWK